MQHGHVARCHHQLQCGADTGSPRQCLGLKESGVHASAVGPSVRLNGQSSSIQILSAAGRCVRIQRIKDHGARASLGERLLFVIDKSALHGEGHQHAQDAGHHIPNQHLVPRHHGVRYKHVRHQCADQWASHVARGGRDRLNCVVLQDRHVLGQLQPSQGSEDHKGKDHAGDAHPK